MRYTLAIYENNKAWLYRLPPETFHNPASFILQVTALSDDDAIKRAESMLHEPQKLLGIATAGQTALASIP